MTHVPELVCGGCHSPNQVSAELGHHAVQDGFYAVLGTILHVQLMLCQCWKCICTVSWQHSN